jgi:hypothetical protein
LDANASVLHMNLHMRNQKPESSTYTDKAQKPTGANGLGEKEEGQGPDVPQRPNGKLWH